MTTKNAKVCYAPSGERRCWLETNHTVDHDYTEIERCDECSGTRWPRSEHDHHCSLFGVDEA